MSETLGNTSSVPLGRTSISHSLKFLFLYIYNNIDIDYVIKDWFITHGFDFHPNFDITNS
jgi:hypothetical protein